MIELSLLMLIKKIINASKVAIIMAKLILLCLNKIILVDRERNRALFAICILLFVIEKKLIAVLHSLSKNL